MKGTVRDLNACSDDLVTEATLEAKSPLQQATFPWSYNTVPILLPCRPRNLLFGTSKVPTLWDKGQYVGCLGGPSAKRILGALEVQVQR